MDAALSIEVLHCELYRLQRACGDRGLVAGEGTLGSDLNLVGLAGRAAAAASSASARHDPERRQSQRRKQPGTCHPCLQWIAGSRLWEEPSFIRPPLSSKASISAKTSSAEL